MLKNILRFFDYIYYRLGRLYFKTDGKDTIAPIAILTVMQIFLFIDFMSIFFSEALAKALSKSNLGISKYLYIIVAIFLFVYNYKRYKHRYDSLDKQWKEESKKVRIIKGLLITFFLISVVAFSGILLNIRNSL